jgi:beta-1,4-N-acetylglucosaminyltransferase
MLAFVTVGSTRFDPLIHAVLEASVLDALRLRGYSTLVVQCGNSDLTPCGLPTAAASDSWKLQRSGVNVEIWKFKPTLETEFRRADLVISHAGAPFPS